MKDSINPFFNLGILQNLGMNEVILILIVAVIIIPFSKIFERAGFHWSLGILMVVPVVNLALISFLAYAPWPIEKNTKDLQQGGVDNPSNAPENSTSP